MSNREFVEGRRDDGWMTDRMRDPQQRYGRDDQERFAREERERYGRDDQQRWGREDERWIRASQEWSPYDRSLPGYRDPSFGFHSQGYNQQGYNQQSYNREQRRLGRPPKGFQRSDERIKEEICEFILRTYWLDAENVVIEVQGGEVTLSGTVDDRQQKRALEDLSSDVLGVKDVHNQIRIQAQPPQERESSGSGRSRKPTA